MQLQGYLRKVCEGKDWLKITTEIEGFTLKILLGV